MVLLNPADVFTILFEVGKVTFELEEVNVNVAGPAIPVGPVAPVVPVEPVVPV